MRRILSTLVLSLLAVSVKLTPSGVAASVDLDIMKKLKDFSLPYLMEELNTLDIDKVEFDGGYIDDIKMDMVI